MKKYIPAIIIIIFFVSASFVSQQYADFFNELILKNKALGMIAYVIAVIGAIVIAPLTSIPFIPLVVGSWGIFWTVVMSIIGWTVGSLIAFWIARKFGAPIVGKLVSIDDKVEKFYRNIPEERLFWYLIFLRIIIPVDILSYMLGLFTNIKAKLFLITTFLGVIPVVVALAYFGNFSIRTQIIMFVIGLPLLIVAVLLGRKIKNSKK